MHLKRMRWPGILLGTSALAAVTTVWAQTGGGYDASFNAFDGGGKTVSGGSYVLQTGVGQPLAGKASGSGYVLDVGVLAGGSGSAAPSPSPSPVPSPGAFKRYGVNVASDGVY